MKRFIHIIPTNAIGGVESAAETTIGLHSENFNLEIIYLSSIQNKTSLFSKFIYLVESSINTFKILKKNPDFIIVSLWKSCFSAYIISLINPKIKIILFLHLPKSTNFLDLYFSKLISNIAIEIWADSNKTLISRCKELNINREANKRIISFQKYKFSTNQDSELSQCNAKFIFWGRIHRQKRLDKAIKLINNIISRGINEVEFLIIGPDCGELTNLKNISKNLGIEDNIIFKKELPFNEIIKLSKCYSFFLQLSDFEGMGMSVMESMQIGLIPIITNVGEISYYCKHKINSIVYKNIYKTSDDILSIISNKDKYNIIKNNSLETWQDFPTYRDDIYKNLEILSMNK